MYVCPSSYCGSWNRQSVAIAEGPSFVPVAQILAKAILEDLDVFWRLSLHDGLRTGAEARLNPFAA